MSSITIFSPRRIGRLLVIMLGLSAICLLLFFHSASGAGTPPAIEFTTSSNDGAIHISWDSSVDADFVQIAIRHDSETILETTCPANQGDYDFSDGCHGNLYFIRIMGIYQDGSSCLEWSEKEALFLDYSQLPDLPLLRIQTQDCLDPTYEGRPRPESDAVGATIYHNDYVPGKLVLQSSTHEDIQSDLQIRIRGNTSAAIPEKKPYKIKLSEKADLLGKGAAYARQEWVLLKATPDLKHLVAHEVEKLLDIPWQLDLMPVNVMLNGDWKGTYYLVEAIDIDSSNGELQKDGSLFEMDAYYWASDGIFFKLSHHHATMGYTFKYPKITSTDNITFIRVKDRLERFEALLKKNNNFTCLDEIDMESFAKWGVARDLMGIHDGAGSNIYYYISSLADPTSKIKMGPLWDHDSAFSTEGEWSGSKRADYTFFTRLNEYVPFQNVVIDTWSACRTKVEPQINSFLDMLWEEKGEALEKSFQLDAARWDETASESEIKVIEGVKDWFSRRVPWMDEQILYMNLFPNTLTLSQFQDKNDALVFYNQSISSWADYFTYSGTFSVSGITKAAAEAAEVCIKSDGIFYQCQRREAYEVQGDPQKNNWFIPYSVRLPRNVSGEICLADTTNKILYFNSDDGKIVPPTAEPLAIDCSDYSRQSNMLCYTDSTNILAEYLHINGWAFVPGSSEQELERMIVCIDVNGTLYSTKKVSRPDVQDAYTIPTSMIGFSVYIPYSTKYSIYIVDPESQSIYQKG